MIQKLNTPLPITLPAQALKLPFLISAIDEVSSGSDVATPRNSAPPTVLPSLNSSERWSAAMVMKIDAVTSSTAIMTNLMIICLSVRSLVSSPSLSALSPAINLIEQA